MHLNKMIRRIRKGRAGSGKEGLRKENEKWENPGRARLPEKDENLE